jgi:hypothetical protein
LNVSRDGVRQGLTKTEDSASTAAQEAAAAADGQMAADSGKLRPAMLLAAEQHTRGFRMLSQGIQKAAEAWTAPLSKTFAKYLTDVEGKLKPYLDEHSTAVTTRAKGFINWVTPQQTPATAFAKQLNEAWKSTYSNLTSRLNALVKALDSGIIDKGDEKGITTALRGVTYAQGQALIQMFSIKPGGSLIDSLNVISGDDYAAAINYVYGNTAEGAKYELAASLHWYNDEEARIEEVMRSLTPDQLEQLHKTDGWKATAQAVKSSLDGTDLKVFEALDAGKPARADALRMRDKIKEAKESGDNDAMTKVLE